MKNRSIALTLGAIITGIVFVFSACKKINESTELGGGLIPPIDNINTFDTTLNVQAFNDTFGLATDSQYLAASAEHFLGLINSDPIFGKTDARIFLQLQPTFYGVYPFARKDQIKIDSIVLVLDYVETYGDSSVPQTVNVYELDQSNNFISRLHLQDPQNCILIFPIYAWLKNFSSRYTEGFHKSIPGYYA